MKPNPPIHLLVRFSDSLLKDRDTIEQHNRVVEQQGAVWFGKMGSPVSQHHIDRLNEQSQAGTPTFVYLVKGNRRKSTAYRANLVLATRDFPEDEQALIPPYYTELQIPQYVKFWVKLGMITPISLEDLGKMKVASSVLSLAETLAKSSTGHFFIKEDKLLY